MFHISSVSKNAISELLFVAVVLLFSFQVSAQISSTAPGNWNNKGTWTNGSIPGISDIATVQHDAVVIPEGVTVEVVSLNIDSGKLVVNGTLIVHGNIEMVKNDAQFSMGANSFVNVYGDFNAKNKIDISISSFLIIQGSFNKTGSGDKGNLDVDEGNIYIFGEATGWSEEFSGCGGEYNGETPDTGVDCDFGNLDDFIDNQDDLPPEVTELLDCFNISEVEDQLIDCNETAHFQINKVDDVTYQWELRTAGSEWVEIAGATNNSIDISPSDAEFIDGNKFRVVVRATAANTGNCQAVVSNIAVLNIDRLNLTWTGAMDSNWNNTGNWSCNVIPDASTNVIIPGALSVYPVIGATSSAEVKDIEIELGASVELKGKMAIFGNISVAGIFSAEEGSLLFSGNSLQNIPASTFEENLVKNLTINNPANVSLGGALDISGMVKIVSGNLFSNNFLRLISNENGTALIDGSGNGEVIGNVAMQRYLDPAFGYKYFSSPFENSIVGDFQDYIDLNSAFPNFYEYNENRKDADGNDATGWETYTTSSFALEVLRGYALNFGNENLADTVEISGIANNGPLSIDLQSHDGKYTQGFQLVGNPYPSPINWDVEAGWEKTNIDDAIYFFTASATDQYTGTYSSYINGISSADGKSSNIIPSMQGFFVHITEPSTKIYPVSAKLSINNLARVNDFAQDFLKSPKTEKEEIPLFSISAKFKNSKSDAVVFYFPGSAKTSFEKKKDALKMMNTEVAVPNIYSLSPEGEKLSINALPFPRQDTEVVIPLGINSQKEGLLQFELRQHRNIDFHIYLIDKLKKTVQDLDKKGDFQLFMPAGEINSRFELLLTYSKMANSEEIFPKLFSTSVTNGIISVKMNLENGNSGNLQLTTLSGQILEQFQVKGTETREFGGIRSSGIYLISLHYEKGVYTEKIMVSN